MRNHTINWIPSLPGLLGLLLLLGLSAIPAANAATLSTPVYKALQQAQRALDKQRPEQALSHLDRAASKAAKAYDRALIEQNRAYVEMARKDYPAAMRAITRALSNKSLPTAAGRDLRYLQAQLFARQGRTEQAIAALESWLHKNPKPPIKAWILLADLSIRTGLEKRGAALLEQALGRDPALGDEVYERLVAVDFRLGDYPRCIALLKTLIQRSPTQTRYWSQLAGSQLAAGQAHEALATLELANLQGYLDQHADYLQLANLYRRQGLPKRAAELLQTLIDQGQLEASPESLQMLAEAWQQAREWRRASLALEQALADCREQDKGPLYLRLGIARYHVGDFQQAYQELLQASGHEQVSSQARQWMDRLGHYLAEPISPPVYPHTDPA